MKFFVSLLTLLSVTLGLAAQISMPAFFADGMVLQQHKINRIWGQAKSGQLIQVNFNGKLYQSIADKRGSWSVYLDVQKAGAVGSIIVQSGSEKKEIKNVLSGEVWVCSGQSNMEWKMNMVEDLYADELKNASNDDIRFVVLAHAVSDVPLQDVSVEKAWSSVNPSTVGDCSAVAYWFAKKIQKQLHVPVGLVITSWGGTPAQSWTSFEGLHDFENYTSTFVNQVMPIDLATINEQQQKLKQKFEQEKLASTPLLQQVVNPAFDDANWKEMELPKPWEAQGFPGLDGIVVYRIKFNVEETDAGAEAVLNLPAIDDIDSTYINGTFIGTNTQWDLPRMYKIPKGVLKAGVNSMVIKVQDNGGGGGLAQTPEKYNVVVNRRVIYLEGKAKYTIAATLEDITGGHGAIQNQPAVLFNGMIAPLVPMAFRGVIWYQGESNADTQESAMEYRKLFPAMISDWRNRWGQGDFPFLFVQLSSFGPLKEQPSESAWAVLRESQTNTLALPNTAMAVTTDVGNPLDIHPHKKREVGERLADGAMKIAYGKTSMVATGPTYAGYRIAGNKVILKFSNTGKGLLIKGTKLKHFAIAGSDKKFVWADAVINGNEIIVSSPQVSNPVAVRYAWADSPVDANLYNKEGYPALPFRTDSW